MLSSFDFMLEYVRKSLRRKPHLSQSLRYLYNLALGKFQKVQIYEISGSVENSDRKITTLFVGREQGAHQFASLVYHHIDKTLPVKELRFGQITPAISTNISEILAIRVEKPAAKEFERQGYLLLPNISFNLDLHGPFEDIAKRMSRRRRRDIKKIEAFNYSYSVSSGDDEDFNFFYWKMYLPYAEQRFGKAAYIKRYNESRAFYKASGGIIFVKKSEKPVAGILFNVIGKTLYAVSMGSLHQDEEHSEQLAGQAALLFLVKWAQMKGLERLDYGTSLPFFKEGVFMYKKEWGMRIEEPLDQSYCALKLNSSSANGLPFLQQNPFIVIDNGMLKGVVLLNHKPTEEELHQIFSEYFLPKLSSMIFIAYYKSDVEPSGSAELRIEPIELSHTLSKPLSSFCLLLQKNAFKVEVKELWGPVIA